MASGSKPQATSDDLLKAILKSGLLSRDELQVVLRNFPRDQKENTKFLADHLIKSGKLSSFQIQKLLKGVTYGLRVGPYVIISPIGKGGMGTVYLGRDTRTSLNMALKILPPKRAKEEGRLLARFQREMQISKRVWHPHVARTFETGQYHGVYYIAMEYIPGVTLHRLVHNEGPLPVQRAAKLFAEIANGLDHAHSQGVIHRDMKPSNIMVTPKGHAKLLDLGLALIEGEISDSTEVIGGRGYIVGSMDYIAPEQTMDAVKVDGRADIYGLGCTLYFALTGTPPFPGGNSKDKIFRHRKEIPRSMAELNPRIPDEFVNIVERMMAKDVKERFASARLVQETLERWAANEPATPLDLPDDSNYHRAIRELEMQSFSSEFVNDPIINNGNGEEYQSFSNALHYILYGDLAPLRLWMAEEPTNPLYFAAGVSFLAIFLILFVMLFIYFLIA